MPPQRVQGRGRFTVVLHVESRTRAADLTNFHRVRMLAACSLGGSGHLNPLLPFLAAARLAGHEVLVIAPPAMRRRLSDEGLPFHEGGEPNESDVAEIREQLARASRAKATVLGNRELFGRLAATAMLPSMTAVCEQWQPDLILREPCEYASAFVAGAMGIRTAQVAISTAAAELGSIAAAAPVLETYRPGLAQELEVAPYLTRFPLFMDPPLFSSTYRYREAPLRAARPLPDWWSGSRAPLIYVTFGSVLGHMDIAAQVFSMALKVASQLRGLRFLMTVGRGFDISTLGPIPAHVHVESWVQQADALAEAALVVCHGGSGTVLGSLAAGVPLVAVPLFADQFSNAAQVAAEGAGVVVEIPRDGTGSRTPEDFSRSASGVVLAVEKMLTEPSFTAAAVSVAGELASRRSPGDVLAELSQ